MSLCGIGARIVPLLLLFAVLTTVAADAAAQDRRYITPRSVDNPSDPPFSGAVMVGNTLYLSGTLGLGPNRTRPATAQEEARNALNNIKGTVEAAGLTMDDLVVVQVFSSNVADYDAFNEVYRTYFTGEFPARAFLGAGTLLFGARFEVQGIAVRR